MLSLWSGDVMRELRLFPEQLFGSIRYKRLFLRKREAESTHFLLKEGATKPAEFCSLFPVFKNEEVSLPLLFPPSSSGTCIL
ncbi:hypothetical protein pipiens_001137 [Culex pipiens pipiens]|uniref:Uncharacterized protein n=1 Tax=Culex pipiens pipiens TaxID=38569 RepID=A0ABD1DR65_CULPP